MSSPISIYIPRISLDTTEEIIMHEFSRTLGKVSRVDFAYLGQQPGFQESTCHYDFKTCFVHFDYFYDNQLVSQVMKFICDDNTSYKYYISINPQAYWLLLRARTVIPKTDMNIHQVVENARYLETSVGEVTNKVDKLFYKLDLQQHEHEANMMDVSVLNDKVHQQAEEIEFLKTQLNDVKQVVYELLNEVFQKREQLEILDGHVKLLDSHSPWNCDTLWPTTSEGDENHERFQDLEKKLSTIL